MITRTQVIDHFKTVEAAAEHFGISVQAIYQWPEGDPIPRERELQLMLEFPRKFGRPKSRRSEVRFA